MLLPEAYQTIVRHDGRSLEEINPGSAESALPRASALRAIDALDGTLIAVHGGDVLVAEGATLRYANENWYCERRRGEAAVDFARRSRAEAQRYVLSYPKNTPAQPLFVLVLDQEQQ